MVNKENVKKFVDALRSGDFKQGRRALRSGDSFCCLGVACELYRRATNKGKWVTDAFNPDCFVDDGADINDRNYLDSGASGAVMTKAVYNYFGFPNDNPVLTKAITKRKSGVISHSALFSVFRSVT